MSAAIYRCNDVEMVFRFGNFRRKEFILKDSLPLTWRMFDLIANRLVRILGKPATGP
jgi:hypothetical protein